VLETLVSISSLYLDASLSGIDMCSVYTDHGLVLPHLFGEHSVAVRCLNHGLRWRSSEAVSLDLSHKLYREGYLA
jgi:hypothetical protein